MSMFFRYVGSLDFADKETAGLHYQTLLSDKESWFYLVPGELELKNTAILFKANGNFNNYISCEHTKELLYEAVRAAIKGSIDVDEGDSEELLWNTESIPAKATA